MNKQDEKFPKISLEEAIEWLKVIKEEYGDKPIPSDAIPPDVLGALKIYGLVEKWSE